MKLTVTAIRILIGALFIGHGTQKLFGWFGGRGLDATATSFESMGLEPGREKALLAGTSEAAGGALFALGLATPLAGAALAGTMIEAIRRVHADKGPWVTSGGWEYNAVLIATVLGVVENGPGKLSLDSKLGLNFRGYGWTLFSLAGALVGPKLASEALAYRLRQEAAVVDDSYAPAFQHAPAARVA
jgi:putative oxidoreductase